MSACTTRARRAAAVAAMPKQTERFVGEGCADKVTHFCVESGKRSRAAGAKIFALTPPHTALMLQEQSLSWTILLLPIIIFPLMIMALGFSWLISAVTVYVRDLRQIIDRLGKYFTVVRLKHPKAEK